jgi:hypothetical protein
VRVAQLHEARGLVGRVGVDGAAQVQRVVGHQPDGRPSMRRQRRVDAGAEAGAQRQQAAGVHQASHGGAGVVHAQAVLGHHVAQGACIGRSPVGTRPWK